MRQAYAFNLLNLPWKTLTFLVDSGIVLML